MATRQAQTGAVVVGVQELDRLRKRFARLEDALKQDEWLVKEIGEQQVNSAKRRIRTTKREPAGKRWKPWSKTYAKVAAKNPNHTILDRTGHLHDSITYEVVSPGEVLVGSNLDYAAAHLYGTDKMPARPFLDTEPGFSDPHDRAELRAIVREFLNIQLGQR